MKKIILLSIFLLLPNLLFAGAARVYTYETGKIIDPAKVTANEDALFTWSQSEIDSYKDGSIINADISGSAGITYGKLSLGSSILSTDIKDEEIVNADISASAGIVDTKLAQISTAGKVDGAALTGLASMPSGAGTIPFANISGNTRFKVGIFTRDTTVASGTQSVTGVGFQPKAVIFFMNQINSREASWGIDDGTIAANIYDGGSNIYYLTLSGASIGDEETAGVGYTGGVSVFGTDGFTITWTRQNVPTGTITIEYLAFR